MIAQGRQLGRFFTKSGLLYELVNDDGAAETEERSNPLQDEEGTGLFDVFQPKRASLAARLGYLTNTNTTAELEEDQAQFVDFCSVC